MNEREQKAMQLFKEGYNCAQAVLLTFCDVTGLDFSEAARLASTFGGGMGRLREVCGAVSAMTMLLGLTEGYDDPLDKEAKKQTYRLVQQLAGEFKKENGSIVCRELLGASKEKQTYVPEERTEEYYKKRPCVELVGMCARIFDEYYNNKNMA